MMMKGKRERSDKVTACVMRDGRLNVSKGVFKVSSGPVAPGFTKGGPDFSIDITLRPDGVSGSGTGSAPKSVSGEKKKRAASEIMQRKNLNGPYGAGCAVFFIVLQAVPSSLFSFNKFIKCFFKCAPLIFKLGINNAAFSLNDATTGLYILTLSNDECFQNFKKLFKFWFFHF